jgi:hypothetical protein
MQKYLLMEILGVIQVTLIAMDIMNSLYLITIHRRSTYMQHYLQIIQKEVLQGDTTVLQMFL